MVSGTYGNWKRPNGFWRFQFFFFQAFLGRFLRVQMLERFRRIEMRISPQTGWVVVKSPERYLTPTVVLIPLSPILSSLRRKRLPSNWMLLQWKFGAELRLRRTTNSLRGWVKNCFVVCFFVCASYDVVILRCPVHFTGVVNLDSFHRNIEVDVFSTAQLHFVSCLVVVAVETICSKQMCRKIQ